VASRGLDEDSGPVSAIQVATAATWNNALDYVYPLAVVPI